MTRIGEYGDVGVYGEAGSDPPTEAIHVLVSTGCVFQAYQLLAKT